MITITIERKDDRIIAKWRNRTAEGATAQEALANMGAEIDTLLRELTEQLTELAEMEPYEECMGT